MKNNKKKLQVMTCEIFKKQVIIGRSFLGGHVYKQTTFSTTKTDLGLLNPFDSPDSPDALTFA